MDTTPAAARIRIFDERVDAVTPAAVLAFAARRIASGQKGLVLNHNVHSLALIRRNPAMRAAYAHADLIEADSTPLILWARMLGKPISRAHRATYLDWRDDFWRLAAQNQWRVFYLGSAPGVAERAASSLRAEWPGVQIAVQHGYFDMDADNQAVLTAISDYRPDIIFVGMGMPRQEAWIAANYGALESGVVFSLGAAFDYEAGVQRAAPRWTGRFGLEWLFRFVADPKRLFERYFIEPWMLLPSMMRDLVEVLRQRGRPNEADASL
ncbi:MAG: WecB/TagA/CpsF family glycosyltransferase [Caulobacteraceae bacterium]